MIARRPAAVLAVMATALAALHLVLVLPVHGFLLSDTTGYLANARWFAGEAGSTWQGPSSFYHPLWSLLVAPIYVVVEVPRHVQIGALVLNGLLSIAVLPAAYVLARRAFALSTGPALAAAGAAATYPAVLLLAGYEWGEALYQLLFIGFVLAVATRRWIAIGALAAALNATHPRGLGVVAVAGVYLLVMARRDRRAVAGLGALVVLFIATRLVNAALLDAIYSDVSTSVEGDVFSRLTDLHLVWGAVKATIGQLWYLTVATFGLVPLGAFWLLARRREVHVVTLAAGLATLAASALQMSDGTRVDHMIYGRYNEGVVPVFLVAGVAAIVAWRRLLPVAAVAIAVLAGGLAGVLVLVRGGDAFTGNVMPLNVTGIIGWRAGITTVDIARATLLALGVTAVVLLASRWRATAGIAVAALVFAGSAMTAQARTLDPFDDTFAGMTRISEVVRSLPQGTIGYDRAAYDHEAANFYQLELADRELRFVDSRKRRPATTYVIAGKDWPRGEGWGARLVYVETGLYDQGLWVMPGRQQERIVAAGDVLPDGPLPAAARRQRLRFDAPSTIDGNDELTVHVVHSGTAAGWRPGAVRLGARWFDQSGEQRAGILAELDHTMLPGQSDDIRLPLIPPTQPGRYTLRIGLLEEGVAWFPSDRAVTVTVR